MIVKYYTYATRRVNYHKTKHIRAVQTFFFSSILVPDTRPSIYFRLLCSIVVIKCQFPLYKKKKTMFEHTYVLSIVSTYICFRFYEQKTCDQRSITVKANEYPLFSIRVSHRLKIII